MSNNTSDLSDLMQKYKTSMSQLLLERNKIIANIEQKQLVSNIRNKLQLLNRGK
ncbi:hypothetical protein KBD09_00735 [Candidatus Woesebacteria bacterium]|nr:hypothetical protein [Candidatus Woesebacteria bacterium]